MDRSKIKRSLFYGLHHRQSQMGNRHWRLCNNKQIKAIRTILANTIQISNKAQQIWLAKVDRGIPRDATASVANAWRNIVSVFRLGFHVIIIASVSAAKTLRDQKKGNAFLNIMPRLRKLKCNNFRWFNIKILYSLLMLEEVKQRLIDLPRSIVWIFMELRVSNNINF